MAKPEKPKPGCFSGFLRVLLCAGNGTSPPVHPSNDNVTEQDEAESLVHSKKDAMFDDNSTTPGLVARLMGLESLPNTNFVMKGATPDSVQRSRSVNFVDYMLNFDEVHGNHHRRVKTSASFREVPAPAFAYRKQDNNDLDLVVLCLDGDLRKKHEVGFELRNLEMGLEELAKQGKKQGKKQGSQSKEVVVRERNHKGKNKKISKLKNEPRRVPSSSPPSSSSKHHGKKVRKQSEGKDLCSVSQSSSSCSSSKLPNKQKSEFVESCHTKRIRKQKLSKKIESDCNSENLSPVSVLDINDYPSLYGANFPEGTSPLASKSKWKSSSLISKIDAIEDSASSNKGGACVYTDVANREAKYYSELTLKLCALTEKDIREFDCTTKHIYEREEFEEICLSFEHKILDLLLHEVVNDVVLLSC